MAKLTIVFGVLLIAVGITGYVMTGSAHPTALIPCWIGLVLVIAGALAIDAEAAQVVDAHCGDGRAAGISGHRAGRGRYLQDGAWRTVPTSDRSRRKGRDVPAVPDLRGVLCAVVY